MAKRRRKSGRRKTSFFSFGKKRKGKRSRSRNSSGTKLIQPDSMIYGAVREKISGMAFPIVAPYLGSFGIVADELAMGGICYLVAKNMSGMPRDIALKGLTIENARIGEAIANGAIFRAVQNTTETGW